MIDISEFSKYVRPEVPDCPEPLIDDAILRACREFCVKTWIVRRPLANIPIVVGQRDYSFTVPDNYDLLSIYDADWYNSVAKQKSGLRPTAEDVLDRQWGVMDWRSQEGQPRNYMLSNTLDTVTVFPIPKGTVADDYLTIYAILIPSLSATLVDDVLYDLYYRAIAARAKVELMQMFNTPWSNLEAVRQYQMQYLSGVGEAKISINRGNMRNSLHGVNRASIRGGYPRGMTT